MAGMSQSSSSFFPAAAAESGREQIAREAAAASDAAAAATQAADELREQVRSNVWVLSALLLAQRLCDRPAGREIISIVSRPCAPSHADLLICPALPV